MAVGAVVFLAGVAVARTVGPLLGLRLAFLGGVVFVFGASAALALAVQRRIDDR